MSTKNLLLVGLTGVVIDDARAHLDMPDLRLFTGTGIGDVRSAFAQARIDHVIMGRASTWRPGSRSSGRYSSQATRQPST